MPGGAADGIDGVSGAVLDEVEEEAAAAAEAYVREHGARRKEEQDARTDRVAALIVLIAVEATDLEVLSMICGGDDNERQMMKSLAVAARKRKWVQAFRRKK